MATSRRGRSGARGGARVGAANTRNTAAAVAPPPPPPAPIEEVPMDHEVPEAPIAPAIPQEIVPVPPVVVANANGQQVRVYFKLKRN